MAAATKRDADAMNASSDEVSLLVVVVDTNPFVWGQRALQKDPNLLDFASFTEHLFAFLHAFLLLHHQNRLAVIAAHPHKSRYLFPMSTDGGVGSKRRADFSLIKRDIKASLADLAALTTPANSSSMSVGVISKALTVVAASETALAAALSLSLCYINRVSKEAPSIRPRVCVIGCSPDSSAQYIPVMNTIFSAQKQSIPVDACVLAADSSFLQQAAHLTGGVYLRPQRQLVLSQYLTSTFLADRFSRQHLVLPTQAEVDYRASCFCHKRVIDVGFVCSVCLSIFCTESAICSTCNTKFSLGPLLLGKLPPKKPKGAAVPAPAKPPAPAVPKGS